MAHSIASAIVIVGFLSSQAFAHTSESNAGTGKSTTTTEGAAGTTETTNANGSIGDEKAPGAKSTKQVRSTTGKKPQDKAGKHDKKDKNSDMN